MKITVFCRRAVRVAHYHPMLAGIESAMGRPWLGETHEHQVVIVVTAQCRSLERDVDLLTLQDTLDDIVAEKVISCGSSSFEAICVMLAQRMGHLHETSPLISVRLEVDGGIEGAEVFL